MPTTVAQYCINVSDLERSIRFYEDVIGLSVRMRVDGDGVTEVLLGGEKGGGQLERWPATIAFVKDPDGYLIELLQVHSD